MKKQQFTILLFVLLLLFTPAIGTAQTCPGAGCPDPDFGTGGTQFIVGNGYGHRDVVVQADGKIISLLDNQNGNTLIRLNPDGSLDTTFDGDGIVQTNWHFNSTLPRGYPFGLALQNIDGEERLVVAGSWNVPAGKNSSVTMLRVDRFKSNGAVDTSFGTNGTGTVLVNKPYALAVAIQPTDNKIITVGDGQAVVRLNEDGTIDTGFGQNGDGATGAGQPGWSIKGLADGSIIIGGSYFQSNTTMMCVSKLNANGSIATSFGSGGRAFADFYGRGGYARAFRVDVDPYGNIVAAGSAQRKNDPNYSIAVARFTPNGQLDPTFNANGKVTYNIAGSFARSILAQMDGKLIVTGTARVSVDNDFALVRFNYNGTVDTTFGSGGRVITNIGGDDHSNSARLWLDPLCACEKIVMAGGSRTGGASFARYLTQ